MTHSGEPHRFAHLAGTVASFDDHAGWGTLRIDDGAEVFFHCTQIADGTRTIPVGAAVTADVLPIGVGEWEAANVERVPSDDSTAASLSRSANRR
ncbi:MAG TPA: cold shock domain-containing protein [Acidimicrobiales bacterium]|nr:cold shock domain-containing protein [Acidimicrobiales bacterium]